YPCGFRANENLGKYWSMPNKSSDSIEHCTRCDWECFRDPSNMLGPFHEFSHSPGKLIKRLLNDRDWVGLWWQDLQYQRAADFCNGRLPPDYSRLRKFSESPGVSVNRNWNEWRPLLWQKISNIELKKLLRVC
ncbi:MAG: hypothetical protein ACRERV_16400, partial [Methylococcales bacterium]